MPFLDRMHICFSHPLFSIYILYSAIYTVSMCLRLLYYTTLLSQQIQNNPTYLGVNTFTAHSVYPPPLLSQTCVHFLLLPSCRRVLGFLSSGLFFHRCWLSPSLSCKPLRNVPIFHIYCRFSFSPGTSPLCICVLYIRTENIRRCPQSLSSPVFWLCEPLFLFLYLWFVVRPHCLCDF